jgi:hypothetical protein
MQDEGGREDTNPPPQYASSAEAEALIKDINNVQEMAVSFAGHLIAVRLSDSCSGNIATARVPIRLSDSGDKEQHLPTMMPPPPPLSEVEETMFDLVVGTAVLLARFRSSRRQSGFALNDKTFVDILSRCERLQDVVLAHRNFCRDGHGGTGVPYQEQVRVHDKCLKT